MKKILFLIICILFLSGCELNIFKSKEINTTDNDVYEEPEQEVKEPEKPKYVDNNPVKISLYLGSDDGPLNKVARDFHKTWVKKRDIAVFNILLTEEDDINGSYFQDIWKRYADLYETEYKVAWSISFTLKDGSKIDKMIYSPKDVEDFYDYLEIYLYDSANVPKDTWYSHLLEKEMTDKTIMTSMKLTAGSKYDEIDSSIDVMAFTYDSDDDFDEEGHYLGNSKYLVSVYND